MFNADLYKRVRCVAVQSKASRPREHLLVLVYIMSMSVFFVWPPYTDTMLETNLNKFIIDPR